MKTTAFAAILLLMAGGLASASDAVHWMPQHAEARIRVLSWNVARGDFFDGGERTVRLLSAAAPDILLLDEMPDDTSPAQLIEVLNRALPGSTWHVELGDPGGNHERGSISSRWPLKRVDRFDRLHYSKREQKRWISQAGNMAKRLRDTLSSGVAAAGAIADIDGKQVLFVSFDMQCCGDQPGAWEEDRRQAEAHMIRTAIEQTLSEQRVDAVVLGGDANNVQDDTVIHILKGEPADLEDVTALREDGSDWTWDGRGTPFASKKIDHVLHGASLRPLQARLLDTEWWPVAMASRLGLQPDASRLQSPHRPIVVDFAF